jgi:hypothetical protein
MSIIKKFDEFVNEMLLKENKNTRPYGKYNILGVAIDEFVKKYYNIDFNKIHGQRYLDFINKHPEINELIEYFEANEDDFTIGVYYYSYEDERGYVDFSIDEVVEEDCERCIKTVKSYTDKNIVNKMLPVIDDILDNKIDIDKVVEWASEYYDAHYGD